MPTTAIARCLSIACLSLVGCAPPLLSTPRHFLELEEPVGSEYSYRATSADGVVLAVRVLELESERGGDLDFWVQATTRQLRSHGGYALLEQAADVKTRSGLAGKQLRFGRDERGKAYRYWLSLFLDAGALYVVEAGGRADRFDARQESIDEAIASLRR